MEHRVVITGMGIVSPIGSTMEAYRENLLAGVCGIDFIRRIDTSDLKVKVGAEVRDFVPTEYMTKIEANKNDRFTQFAIGAAAQAVEMSGIAGKVDPFRFGVYFGSGIGGFRTFTDE